MHYDIETITHSLIFLLACLVLFLIGKLVYKFFNSGLNANVEITDKDNVAFIVSYVGYFIGVLLAVGGVMHSEGGEEFSRELLLTMIYGLVSLVVLNLSGKILDGIVSAKVDFKLEILERQNLAAGVVKGANYINTGILMYGVLLVDVNKPLEGFGFLAIALVLVFISTKYYDLITPFKVQEQVKEGNLAVAFGAAGAQIAIAILINSGIQIEHSSWLESLNYIGMDMLAGLLMLPMIRLIVDKIFLPKAKLTDELINQDVPNAGVGLIEAFAYIAGALFFVWCWNF